MTSLYNLYWRLLHEASFHQAPQAQVDEFIVAVLTLLDCPECRDEALVAYKNDQIKSPSQKILDLHNNVNSKTAGTRATQTWSLAQAEQTYRVPRARLAETYINLVFNVSIDATVDLSALQRLVDLAHGLLFSVIRALKPQLDADVNKRKEQINQYARTLGVQQPTLINQPAQPVQPAKRTPVVQASGCSSCQKRREAEQLRQREAQRAREAAKSVAVATPAPVQVVARTPQVRPVRPVAPVPPTQRRAPVAPVPVDRKPVERVRQSARQISQRAPVRHVAQAVQRQSDLKRETHLLRRMNSINSLVRDR